MFPTKQVLKMLGDTNNPLVRLLSKDLFSSMGLVTKSKKIAHVVYFDPLKAEWVRETATMRDDGSVIVGWDRLGRCGLT
jgi:hypothetical protein